MRRVAKLDKGVTKRGIVTPDKHFPLHDEKAINCLLKAINLIKPDFYIDLGDVGEFESVSHWQWKKKKRPPLEYQLPFVEEEVKDANPEEQKMIRGVLELEDIAVKEIMIPRVDIIAAEYNLSQSKGTTIIPNVKLASVIVFAEICRGT